MLDILINQPDWRKDSTAPIHQMTRQLNSFDYKLPRRLNFDSYQNLNTSRVVVQHEIDERSLGVGSAIGPFHPRSRQFDQPIAHPIVGPHHVQTSRLKHIENSSDLTTRNNSSSLLPFDLEHHHYPHENNQIQYSHVNKKPSNNPRQSRRREIQSKWQDLFNR
ncbi:hypothetical protein OIO90_006141 [Microbotryomycetes sp. JL221]|nr:hypothetical protein OIO90_006141 [Microbotryomycetes sp. JL221]